MLYWHTVYTVLVVVTAYYTQLQPLHSLGGVHILRVGNPQQSEERRGEGAHPAMRSHHLNPNVLLPSTPSQFRGRPYSKGRKSPIERRAREEETRCCGYDQEALDTSSAAHRLEAR